MGFLHKARNIAHRQRILVAALVFLLSAVFVLTGVQRLFGYSLPMLSHNYSAVAGTTTGSTQAVALYDRAMVDYESAVAAGQANNADNAFLDGQNDLNAAYNDLQAAGNGSIPPQFAKLAGDIEFQLATMLVETGIVNQNVSEVQEGMQDYVTCLQAAASNIYAKYDLELLEQSGKVNGGKNPTKPGGKTTKGSQQGNQPSTGTQAGHSQSNGT